VAQKGPDGELARDDTASSQEAAETAVRLGRKIAALPKLRWYRGTEALVPDFRLVSILPLGVR
jgi:hypothetical protein